MKIHYSKFRYYLLFFYYKLKIFSDCTSGRRRLYVAEFLHLWNVIFHTSYEMPEKNFITTIQTIFGKYKFIGDYNGYSVLSPAFERPDKEYLFRMIRESVNSNKKVLFLDIGSYVGDYCIGISRLINNNNLKTIAFEPDPLHYKLLP